MTQLQQKFESLGYKVVKNPYNTKLQILKFDEEWGMKPETGYFPKSELSKKIKSILSNH